MRHIYYTVKETLIDREWKIKENAKEDSSGELREFIHPKTGKLLAWIDALLAESELEMKLGYLDKMEKKFRKAVS